MTVSPFMRPIRGVNLDPSEAGVWTIIARPPRGEPVNITAFRGLPTKIGAFSFADPNGPTSLDLSLPGVSLFERYGENDLHWLTRQSDIDVIWTGDIPADYPYGKHNLDGTVTPAFRWEGYVTTFNPSNDGLKLQLKGAMLQLDNWQAKPEYPMRPLPYEWAISRQFREKPALRVHPLRIIWPDDWRKVYVPQTGVPSYRIPAGVTGGEKWTGLLTRSTGSWDPVLTNYIQSLLSAMYTEKGRWTLDLDINRQPVMFHRDFAIKPGPATVIIDPAAPGVDISLTEDWEQSLTDVYAQGTSLAGVTYSGMTVSGDGSQTSYTPAAALRQTYPAREGNDWFDHTVMPREVMLQVQEGLSADDAAIVARAHLTRFADPGHVGTITLKSDPSMNGTPISRFLVRAGMDVQVPFLFGRPEGLLLHISASSADLEGDTVTLTVDTKNRDALTVEEVRTRGRDALQVSRMLVAGQYAPPVSDQMFPWSYADGSGYIPSNSDFSSKPLFSGMPDQVTFPWTQWTTQRPPSDHRWKNCYIHLSRASSDANQNWAVQHSAWGSNMGIPIRMGQAGTIRLLQVAAYDSSGNIMRVPFHLSFFYVGSVNVLSMPAIPVQQASLFPPYAANQRYPFVRDGWESYLIDGTRAGLNDPKAYESAGPVRIYGTFYEKAGYWPGSYSDGDEPTGLLVDETTWTWDLTGQGDALWDPYNVERNLNSPQRGNLYAMLYCDAQLDQDVYFLGRMYRVEPGGN